jgi:hypothetical protein
MKTLNYGQKVRGVLLGLDKQSKIAVWNSCWLGQKVRSVELALDMQSKIAVKQLLIRTKITF